MHQRELSGDVLRVGRSGVDHQALVEAAPVALFACDVDGSLTYVNPAWSRMTGLSAAESLGNGWTRAVHPDDLATVWARWDASVRTGEPCRGSMRWRHADGTVVSTTVLVVPTFGAHGGPIGWAGSAVDVTAHEALRRELEAREDRFREIVELSTDVVYRISSSPLRVDYLSPSAEALVGRPAADFYANPMLLAAVVHPDDLHLLVASLDPDQRHPRLRLRLVRTDGTVVHVEAHGRPLLDERGVKVGMQGSLRDISAQHELERRLLEQASTDPLTGLANRRALIDALEHGSRVDRPLALLFLDVDDLKQINDRHGHAAGDRVLAAVADRLRRAARPVDVVARLAGDEFVALCPGVTAADMAVRLGPALNRPVLLPDRTRLDVTVSIGGIDGSGSEPAHALLARADEAMYRAKRARTDGGADAARPPG